MLVGHVCNFYCIGTVHRDVFLVPSENYFSSAYYRDNYNIDIISFSLSKGEITKEEIMAEKRWDSDKCLAGFVPYHNSEFLHAYDVSFRERKV